MLGSRSIIARIGLSRVISFGLDGCVNSCRRLKPTGYVVSVCSDSCGQVLSVITPLYVDNCLTRPIVNVETKYLPSPWPYPVSKLLY